jgi:hypothetical protein
VLTLTTTLALIVHEVKGRWRIARSQIKTDGRTHLQNKNAINTNKDLLLPSTLLFHSIRQDSSMKLFASITLLAAMLDMAAAFAPSPAFGVSRSVAPPTATFLVPGKSPLATMRLLYAYETISD